MRRHIGTLMVVTVAGVVLVSAKEADPQTLSTYGTPGLIDMPTADALPDGNVALTTNIFGKIRRNTFTFQLLPRLSGSFRYSIIDDFDPGGGQNGTRYDRSFDLHYQLMEETDTRPALAFGLRDFGGTGIYSSEYIVASKALGSKLKVTGGLGWGRMGERKVLDGFGSRPDVKAIGVEETGQVDFSAWFKGPIGVFGGVEYRATDRLSFQVEYSSDKYSNEAGRGVIDIDTPFNVGVSYDFDSGSSLRAFSIGGTEVGLQYSYTFDPAKRRSPGGLESAPRPVVPRNQAILASVDLSDPEALAKAEGALKALLADDGIYLQGFTTSAGQAGVRVENRRWDIEAQAVGRTARAMAAVLPANIDVFTITFQDAGVANSSVSLRRSDLEELDTDYDGTWRSLARAQIEDAYPVTRAGELAGAFPEFRYGLGPYFAFSFFDPDEPLRFDLGVQLALEYTVQPGLTFSGVFRQPVVGNIDKATRESDSVLPRVRSDAALYAQESDIEINRLTAEYMFRPGEDLFGRVTVGYLESMFGGVSGELLWFPIDSRLALGAEINYARQRDFDMLLGFQDYDVVTGHGSVYYDLGNSFTAQVDVGRYLAGDWGATFGVDREFNNGFKIGGFFTQTDVSYDDFGEGSFDKGIRVSIPLSWLTGKPSRDVVSDVIRPVLRDGGARLNVANRLYGVTRDYRADKLTSGWGRIYR